MILIIKFILLLVGCLIGYSLGWYFTEECRLADKHPLFDFEAFKCRQCLTFHITWVTTTIMSLAFGDWIMLGVGLFFAFMIFLGIRIDEKNKTINLSDYEMDK